MKMVEKLKDKYNLIDHIKEWVEYIIDTNKVELQIIPDLIDMNCIKK